MDNNIFQEQIIVNLKYKRETGYLKIELECGEQRSNAKIYWLDLENFINKNKHLETMISLLLYDKSNEEVIEKTKEITDIIYKFMKNIEGSYPLLIGRKKHLLLQGEDYAKKNNIIC